MNLRALFSSLVVASLSVSLAACGDIESSPSGSSAPSNNTVVGTWLNVNNSAQMTSALEYRTDGTFTITTAIARPPSASALAGCVSRTIITGRYAVSGATLTQSDVAGTSGNERCANPTDNSAQAPRDPADFEGLNRAFTYEFVGNTLRLISADGAVQRYYRP